MNESTVARAPIEFEPGASLDLGELPGAWRLRRGVLSLASESAHLGARVHTLALPGDLIGVENLGGSWSRSTGVSITAATLEPVLADQPEQRVSLLCEAYEQARRQCLDLLRLRSGAVTERIRHLLMLLGDHGGDGSATADLELPTLRHLAALTDSAPESVCRVLSRLRDMRVLACVAPRRTRMSLQALRELQVPEGMTASSRARTASLRLAA